MTEFAFNAATSVFIELFVFITNYDFESRMSFDSISIEESARKWILSKKTFDIIEKMKKIWEFTKKRLINAQKSQKRHANSKKSISFEYKLEDMMWLFTKNIKIKRSFKKLNHKSIEFYKIQKILKNVC